MFAAFQFEKLQAQSGKHGEDLRNTRNEISETNRAIQKLQADIDTMKNQVGICRSSCCLVPALLEVRAASQVQVRVSQGGPGGRSSPCETGRGKAFGQNLAWAGHGACGGNLGRVSKRNHHDSEGSAPSLPLALGLTANLSATRPFPSLSALRQHSFLLLLRPC